MKAKSFMPGCPKMRCSAFYMVSVPCMRICYVGKKPKLFELWAQRCFSTKFVAFDGLAWLTRLTKLQSVKLKGSARNHLTPHAKMKATRLTALYRRRRRPPFRNSPSSFISQQCSSSPPNPFDTMLANAQHNLNNNAYPLE